MGTSIPVQPKPFRFTLGYSPRTLARGTAGLSGK